MSGQKDNRMGQRMKAFCRPPTAIGHVLGALLSLGVATGALAGDWPQILGPHRNGKADGEQLEAWPATGPKMLWQRSVGSGFAGAAVVGGRAVIFHRLGKELVAEALDAATGQPHWKVTFETSYRGSISPDDGPRCVPLVHGNHVYLFGPGGELACVTFDAGKKVWQRQAYREFDAPEGYFGAGSSPIVEGDRLLVNVGGADGAGLVAFGLGDGKTIWKATDEGASYSSPTAATIGGLRHVVFVTRLNVVSVDPRDGTVRFRFPFGQRGPTVNAANPLVLGDHVFVSASYGVGAQWAKIDARRATTVWESDDVMSSQYTTSIEHQGALYGLDGRQDIGVARLRAFDPRTGKVHWTQEDFGTGNLILAGDQLLVMKTDGDLVLVEPSPKAYRPLASARIFDTTVQALPALSSGLFFARDTQTLKCFRIGK
jgi:outer membrane protein assembly factor BamB